MQSVWVLGICVGLYGLQKQVRCCQLACRSAGPTLGDLLKPEHLPGDLERFAERWLAQRESRFGLKSFKELKHLGGVEVFSAILGVEDPSQPHLTPWIRPDKYWRWGFGRGRFSHLQGNDALHAAVLPGQWERPELILLKLCYRPVLSKNRSSGVGTWWRSMGSVLLGLEELPPGLRPTEGASCLGDSPKS